MAGYKNRTFTLTFPDLGEDGDEIYVVLRHPRTVPGPQLQPREFARNPDGSAINPLEEQDAAFEVLASLIVDWHVYDATSTEEDQPLLPLPADSKIYAKLPLEIQAKIPEEIATRRDFTRTPSTPNS